jgi:hypothetical protein
MTQLSRLAILGIAKEAAAGTYLAPTTFIPFSKADYSDDITYIKDESFRANDSVLQGLYPGSVNGDWSIDVMAYPDLIGLFLRGIIGPDTVVAGTSSTISASTTIGATSITTAAAFPVGSYVKIDTAASVEYAKVTASSGSGPYVLTVTTVDGAAVGLTKAHTSGATVVGQTTHTFKSTSVPTDKATYSLTVYDTVDTRGYSDFVLSDLQIKIDPKNAVTMSVKGKCLEGVAQSAMTPSFTALSPALGWQWQMTNAGAASTRGLSYDVSVKRSVDVINSSDGTQGPREIFQGAMDASGSYKAIFENRTDIALYEGALQGVTSALLQQPAQLGGTSLALTMSQGGWSKGKRDMGGDYVQASYTIDGIYNAADGGVISAVVKNWVSAAY